MNVVWQDQHRDQLFVDWLEGLTPGARLLEIGAGRHPKQFEAHQVGAWYVGLDLHTGPDAAPRIVRGDAHHLPFPDQTFEAALALGTLEHVAQPWSVIRELARVLRPGGALLWHACFWQWEHPDPRDYFRFTRQGAVYLTEEIAGLEVVRVEGQVDPREPDGDLEWAPSYWSVEAVKA